MFDIIGGTTFPSTVRIEEHRAPTADSARLYGELLEKARKEVLEAIPLQCNALKATVVRRALTHVMLDQYIVRFSLNGQEHNLSIVLEEIHKHLGPEIVAKEIRNAVTRAVSAILFESVAPEIAKAGA